MTRGCHVAHRITRAPRARHGTTRVVLLLACITTLLSACRHDATTGPSATPTTLRLSAGSGQTGTVGAALATPLSVIVLDASGKTISGAQVDWDVGVGAGTVSPTVSTSNSSGVAQTSWTLGTNAGNLRVTAQINGLTPVVFTATAISGGASQVVATPDRAYLGVGDTIRIRAAARDQFGNDLVGQSINFSSPDATIASVSSNGLVTTLAVGTAR